MLALKCFVRTIALPAALVCLGAASTAESQDHSGFQSPPSRVARMQCRMYFGCLPVDWLATRHPLSDGQE